MRLFDTHSAFPAFLSLVAFSSVERKEGREGKQVHVLLLLKKKRKEKESLFVYTGLGQSCSGDTDGFPVFRLGGCVSWFPHGRKTFVQNS